MYLEVPESCIFWIHSSGAVCLSKIWFYLFSNKAIMFSFRDLSQQNLSI